MSNFVTGDGTINLGVSERTNQCALGSLEGRTRRRQRQWLLRVERLVFTWLRV